MRAESKGPTNGAERLPAARPATEGVRPGASLERLETQIGAGERTLGQPEVAPATSKNTTTKPSSGETGRREFDPTVIQVGSVVRELHSAGPKHPEGRLGVVTGINSDGKTASVSAFGPGGRLRSPGTVSFGEIAETTGIVMSTESVTEGLRREFGRVPESFSAKLTADAKAPPVKFKNS